MVNNREKMEPSDIEEQKILGPPGSTGEYVSVHLEDFRHCLRKILLQIAPAAASGQQSLLQDAGEQARHCHRRYVQSMKGGVNVTEEDLLAVLRAEEIRQKDLCDALRELSERFAQHAVNFEIGESGFFGGQILWRVDLSAGRRVRTDNGAILYAYPLRSARTDEYLVPRSGPIAARVIFLEKRIMLFMPHGEDPGPAFEQAAAAIFGTARDVTGEFQNVHSAVVEGALLRFVIIQPRSLDELERLRHEYGTLAVMMGDPHQFSAMLLAEREEPDIRLLDEIGSIEGAR